MRFTEAEQFTRLLKLAGKILNFNVFLLKRLSNFLGIRIFFIYYKKNANSPFGINNIHKRTKKNGEKKYIRFVAYSHTRRIEVFCINILFSFRRIVELAIKYSHFSPLEPGPLLFFLVKSLALATTISKVSKTKFNIALIIMLSLKAVKQ